MTVKNVTVPDSIDDSTALQKLIEKTGNTATIYTLSPDTLIEINSLLRFYNNTKVLGGKFKLKANASPSLFGLQIPLIGGKLSKGVTGIILDGLYIDGNYAAQKDSIKADGADHGKGRNNLIGFGDMYDPQYANVTNCIFRKLTLKNGLGDGIRINGGSGLTIENITCDYLGHDDIHLNTVNGADVNTVIDKDLRTNNLVRTRSSSNIDIHSCYASSGKAYDTGPVFTAESITNNRVSQHIRYFNNEIRGSRGSVFDAGADHTASDLQIFNNLIINSAYLEAAIGHWDVGAFTIGGWSGVKIFDNTVVDCRGYGFLDKSFAFTTSQQTSAEIYNNIIIGMKKGNVSHSGTGSPVAKIYSNSSINVHDNCFWKNATDPYGVKPTGSILKDPLFTSDYHLQSGSPCPSWGRYGDTQEEDPVQEDITKLLISCKNCDVNDIVKSISYSYKIYRGY
jgi:hypothetical protein